MNKQLPAPFPIGAKFALTITGIDGIETAWESRPYKYSMNNGRAILWIEHDTHVYDPTTNMVVSKPKTPRGPTECPVCGQEFEDETDAATLFDTWQIFRYVKCPQGHKWTIRYEAMETQDEKQ